VKPIVLRPGEGESLTLFGNSLELKAGAADTGGGLCLVDYTAGPGFAGPPPHRHNHTFEEIREALGDGPPDPAVMGELMAKYDIELER
jgi:hypothetical protein